VIYGRSKEVTGNEKDCFTLKSACLHLCKGNPEDLLNLDLGNVILLEDEGTLKDMSRLITMSQLKISFAYINF
jgi:hypothetical protein